MRTMRSVVLDLLCVEPSRAGNPLLAAKTCFSTPHIAWATRAARSALAVGSDTKTSLLI